MSSASSTSKPQHVADLSTKSRVSEPPRADTSSTSTTEANTAVVSLLKALVKERISMRALVIGAVFVLCLAIWRGGGIFFSRNNDSVEFALGVSNSKVQEISEETIKNTKDLVKKLRDDMENSLVSVKEEQHLLRNEVKRLKQQLDVLEATTGALKDAASETAAMYSSALALVKPSNSEVSSSPNDMIVVLKHLLESQQGLKNTLETSVQQTSKSIQAVSQDVGNVQHSVDKLAERFTGFVTTEEIDRRFDSINKFKNLHEIQFLQNLLPNECYNSRLWFFQRTGDREHKRSASLDAACSMNQFKTLECCPKYLMQFMHGK